jgi:hypothetical protein
VAWAVRTCRRRSGDSPHEPMGIFTGDSGVDEGLRMKAAKIGNPDPFSFQVDPARIRCVRMRSLPSLILDAHQRMDMILYR